MGAGQIHGNLQDVVPGSLCLTTKECHGIRVGAGLKKMITPEGATGTLVACGRRTARMLSIIANPNGTDMSTVHLELSGRDEMCYIVHLLSITSTATSPTSWSHRKLHGIHAEFECRNHHWLVTGSHITHYHSRSRGLGHKAMTGQMRCGFQSRKARSSAPTTHCPPPSSWVKSS